MSGVISKSPDMNSGIVGEYPVGHILRSFYDESDAALHLITSGSTLEFGEMELTITGGGSASNFLQVTIGMNGIYNLGTASGVFTLGVVYSSAGGGSFSGVRFGTVDAYTRTNYISTTTGLNVDSTIVVRAAHPSTSTYYIRPRIYIETANMNINQASGPSTISALEIKG